MRVFPCGHCGLLQTFESTTCARCGHAQGFRWPERELELLGDAPRCANEELAGCNWTVAAPGELCFSCALTRTRPNDFDAPGLAQLPAAEAAKRRLLFELGELGLPITPSRAEGDGGLIFDLLSSSAGPVTTGHADGVITLDLAETDDAHREALRAQLDEPYRTLLGHMRHEVGHYYWTVLAPQGDDLLRVRALLGDDTADYGAALQRHYDEGGAPAGWQESFVSAYATMHPMEDWAETWAHLLHIRDSMQTVAAYQIAVGVPEPSAPVLVPTDTEELLKAWAPIAFAVNELNRSMGQDDLYPFVLAVRVREKLALVDELVRGAAQHREDAVLPTP